MNRPFYNIIILLSLLLLVFGGCGDGGGNGSSLFFVSEPFSFEVPEGTNTDLRVLGVNGIIEINGSATVSTITITGMMKVGSASSAESWLHINDLDIEVTEAAGVLTAETVQPSPAPTGINYIVEYSITVPDTFSIAGTQINGEIYIQGMESDITVSQANGTIDVDAVMPSGGLFDLSTANGEITLTIPTNTSADFMCQSATGSVHVYNLTVLSPVTGPHSLSGTLDGGNGNIEITTANGDITLQGII